jgi:hypothetical protein
MSDNYTTDAYGRIAVPSVTRYGYTDTLPYVLGDGRVREIAEEIAGSIIQDARNVEGPVVWITGNSYMPPLRSVTQAERVYQADNNHGGELWTYLVETLEALLERANVYLGSPDYDNALYAVDMRRWQWVDPDDPQNNDTDDLNLEWERIPETEQQ